MRTLFYYLGNSWTDCAELWCVVRDPLVLRFTKVDGSVQVHVPTPFPYLGNGWTDCAGTWCVFRGPLTMRSTQDGDVRTSARVHTFKHICSLPLIHRPKGVLLVAVFIG